MTYTDEALIDLFKNDPEEFLKVCSDISDASGELPQFGKYIYIKQSLATNRPLPKGATALLDELEEIYGGIDTSMLQPYNGPIDIAYFETTLSTLLNKLADQLKQKDQLVYEGMIEFVEALTENVRFSKGKRDRNGYKYQIDKVNELISWLDNFKTKVYKLEGDLSIWLTPSRFFHILIGHVEGYIVPRKGGAVRFTDIYSCAQLLEFVNQLVENLKPDLIAHYTVGSGHFERKDILFRGARFAIHIKRKRIISLYPVNEDLLKKIPL